MSTIPHRAAGDADQLTRSFWVSLEQKGAGLRVLEPEFCTSGDTGRIMVTVLGWRSPGQRFQPSHSEHNWGSGRWLLRSEIREIED
jgi:hypothetical protein